MLETFEPGAGARLNVDFGFTTLDGRAGGSLSLGPSRITGFERGFMPGVRVFFPGGGEVLPTRRVESVFVREKEGRLSGDVRREVVRESG